MSQVYGIRLTLTSIFRSVHISPALDDLDGRAGPLDGAREVEHYVISYFSFRSVL